jgi:8-oxo-dGTP pyrophosphatase MutT (NUDIX family)
MPDAMVFPGGKLDEADRRMAKLATATAEEEAALALKLAAARETFEEAGLTSLLKSNGSSLPGFSELVGWRKQVYSDASKFLSFCEAHQLEVDVNGIFPFCRFVTPEFEALKAGKGFDAQFFLCMEESESSVSSATEDRNEVVELQWLAPQEALLLFDEGEIFLPPPQYHILHEVRL